MHNFRKANVIEVHHHLLDENHRRECHSVRTEMNGIGEQRAGKVRWKTPKKRRRRFAYGGISAPTSTFLLIAFNLPISVGVAVAVGGGVGKRMKRPPKGVGEMMPFPHHITPYMRTYTSRDQKSHDRS